MRTRLIGMSALALFLGACGGSGSEGANGAKLTNNVAATAEPGGSDAEARVKALPEA